MGTFLAIIGLAICAFIFLAIARDTDSTRGNDSSRSTDSGVAVKRINGYKKRFPTAHLSKGTYDDNERLG